MLHLKSREIPAHKSRIIAKNRRGTKSLRSLRQTSVETAETGGYSPGNILHEYARKASAIKQVASGAPQNA